MCISSYNRRLDRGMLCLEEYNMFVYLTHYHGGDSALVVGGEVPESLRVTKHQGEFMMTDVISIDRDLARMGEYWVQIAWIGLEYEVPTWELMSTIYADVSMYLEKKLREDGTQFCDEGHAKAKL